MTDAGPYCVWAARIQQPDASSGWCAIASQAEATNSISWSTVSLFAPQGDGASLQGSAHRARHNCRNFISTVS